MNIEKGNEVILRVDFSSASEDLTSKLSGITARLVNSYGHGTAVEGSLSERTLLLPVDTDSLGSGVYDLDVRFMYLGHKRRHSFRSTLNVGRSVGSDHATGESDGVPVYMIGIIEV